METTRPSLRAFTSFLLAIITIISYLSICCRSDCALLHGYTSCPKLIPLKSQSLHKGVYMHNELYDTLIHIIEHNRKEQCLLFPEHPQLFLKVCYLQYLLILAVQCENTIEKFLWEICNFFFSNIEVCTSVFLVRDLSLKSHGIVFVQSIRWPKFLEENNCWGIMNEE